MRFIHIIVSTVALCGVMFMTLLLAFFWKKDAVLALVNDSVQEARNQCYNDPACIIRNATTKKQFSICDILQNENEIVACKKIVIQKTGTSEEICEQLRSEKLRQECIDRKKFENQLWSNEVEPVINNSIYSALNPEKKYSDSKCIKTMLHSQVEDFDAKVYVWYSCAPVNGDIDDINQISRGIALIRLQKRDQWNVSEVNTTGWEMKNDIQEPFPDSIQRRAENQRELIDVEKQILKWQ